MRKIELLAPAKNYETGLAAVDCGADAVYIGPEKFGARSSAGNSLQDIAGLVNYAHRYRVSVYATVNTILFDNELEDARALIIDLYNEGVDGIIFQDMALLEMDLPPVPLHASTQCDNYDIEKIKFLDSIGVPRIVLARELTVDEVREIRGAVSCELEYFIHGALCVSMSGRCYMSAALGGRSANRGECAQPCRKSYILTDSDGKVIPAGRYPLSLKDLNRTASIGELIDAGIDSFKIEGRLKDINYVRNVVAHYRREIDRCLEGKGGIEKSSSGISVPGFTPDPERTFNRGYTGYFTHGRMGKMLSSDTPKSLGKRIGTVNEVAANRFRTDPSTPLKGGDGLFFLNPDGSENGVRVNRFEDGYVYPFSMEGIYRGAEIFRNFDSGFEKTLETSKCIRRVPVDILFRDTESGFEIVMTDCEGHSAAESQSFSKELSLSEKNGEEQIKKQLGKLGNTLFTAGDIKILLSDNWFIPVSVINDIRRKCSDKLESARMKSWPVKRHHMEKSNVEYPYKRIDYSWNVSNSLAKKFYERHEVETIDESFETGSRSGGEPLMTTKMCVKYENGLCPKYGGRDSGYREPFILDDGKNRFTLRFDCENCFMIVRMSATGGTDNK
ncbi:MAG TPA: U32 family peptidase [Spirochaetota bacterium]|nr:U32 family peptidase [Spirochaetota bacterium]